MVLGMPLYGRAFQNTNGPGTPFSGVGEGSWESGVWDFKALPRPGASEQVDASVGASWCYDPASRTMVSYDNIAVGEIKANFIRQQGLGGGMWWESSGDRGGKTASKTDGSLIGTFVEGVGGIGALDQSPNNLEFPESKFENLRAGIPGE
jgi:chitinase